MTGDGGDTPVSRDGVRFPLLSRSGNLVSTVSHTDLSGEARPSSDASELLFMTPAPGAWFALCAGDRYDSNLVDPASSHMLVSKIKPCMSQYKLLYGETANGLLK